MRIRILVLVSFLACFSASILKGQNLNNALRQGNNAYKERYYGDAIAHYKDALKVDSSSVKAKFALADAYYQKKQDSLAMNYYQDMLQDSLSRSQKAEVLHNIGNLQMRAKDYKKAFETYKQSLILNPNDDDTRYNLVLAQKLMPKDKKQPQQQNQQNQQDQNKQKKKQQDKKKEPKKQEPPKNNQEKPKQDKQKQQDKSQKDQKELNKKQLEQLLDSYKANDEKTRQKMQKVQTYLKNKDKQKAKKKW